VSGESLLQGSYDYILPSKNPRTGAVVHIRLVQLVVAHPVPFPLHLVPPWLLMIDTPLESQLIHSDRCRLALRHSGLVNMRKRPDKPFANMN
jgi:hypothetical protein